MTSEADVTAERPLAPAAATPSALSWMRLFYWSLRRELWEHRAVYIAPLSVAALALLGFVISSHRVVHAARAAAILADPRQVQLLAIPYVFVAVAVIVIGLVVAIIYSQSALHGERRDRSILFWKSLPVSDLTTVLAKAAVPIVVMPAVLFVTILAAQLIMLAWSTAILLVSGVSPQGLWAHLPLTLMWQVLSSGLPFIALWYAPFFAWLILVSAWAKRMPFLWAVAPPLALGLVERLAFGTTFVWSWLKLRMFGAFAGAFSAHGHGMAPIRHPSDLDATSWGNPHLWIGLVLAAAFLAAAVRLRRSADPI